MSTLITGTHEISRFTAAFADVAFAHELASQFSCLEVEALAGLLKAFGEMATADLWIQAHAHGDDIADMHYQAPAEPYIVPIDPMDDLQCDSCQ